MAGERFALGMGMSASGRVVACLEGGTGALVGPAQLLTLLLETQGGVKVLITGPWVDAVDQYTCLFDQMSVPASLIQAGVLRCYCPGTEPPEASWGAGGRNGQGLTPAVLTYVLLLFLLQPTRLAWFLSKWLTILTWPPCPFCLSTGPGTSWLYPAPSWIGSL